LTQFTATSPEQLLGLDQMRAMSGLEFLQGILDGKISGAPMATAMNLILETIAPGRVTFLGTPEFRHSNPMHTTHGGWAGAMLDSVLGCTVLSNLEKGSGYTTLEYKVNITRAIPMGLQMRAIGTSQHAGRSTGVANGEIRGVADGRLYATGSTTCIIL